MLVQYAGTVSGDAELGLERHNLDPDLAVRQGEGRTIGAVELSGLADAGATPLQGNLGAFGDEYAFAAADQGDVDAARVVIGDRLDVGKLDHDRRGGVLHARCAILVRLVVHDALVDFLTGLVVVL